MKILPYSEVDAAEWDNFLETSFNGTFLHSRRFLSYHGSRFEDASLRILDTRNRLVGILPAAANPTNPTEVISHPGITYGGLIHGDRLHGTNLLNSFERILETYRGQGFQSFLYKAIPKVYQVVPSEDDLYALFRLGGDRVRCDLSAAVDLERCGTHFSQSLRKALKKAQKHGIRIEQDFSNLEAFWEILSEKLFRRHSVAPVHTVAEMRELARRFPDNIALVTAFFETEVVAGTVLFKTRLSVHAQYGVCNDRGGETGALEFAIEKCILDARNGQKRYFDFGISNEQEGTVLNEGLHQFKTKFGAGGVVHEFYRIKL